VTDAVTLPQWCCDVVRSAILATVWLLVAVGDNKKMGRKGKERYGKSQDISAICGAEIPGPILIEFGVRVAPHDVGLIKMSNVCNKIFMSFRSTGDQN